MKRKREMPRTGQGQMTDNGDYGSIVRFMDSNRKRYAAVVLSGKRPGFFMRLKLVMVILFMGEITDP